MKKKEILEEILLALRLLEEQQNKLSEDFNNALKVFAEMIPKQDPPPYVPRDIYGKTYVGDPPESISSGEIKSPWIKENNLPDPETRKPVGMEIIFDVKKLNND